MDGFKIHSRISGIYLPLFNCISSRFIYHFVLHWWHQRLDLIFIFFVILVDSSLLLDALVAGYGCSLHLHMKRGIVPGIMGSLATKAMYFGVIESTKKWMEKTHPNLNSHWVHFFSGPMGDILGSCVCVPCEVMKQRIQVQGSKKYWATVMAKEGSHAGHGMNVYGYYFGMLQAGCSKWKERWLKGLCAW